MPISASLRLSRRSVINLYMRHLLQVSATNIC